MKIAIVGSRHYTNYKAFSRHVRALLDPDDEIVTGDARGVDEMTRRLAAEQGLPLTVFRADWDAYGRAAGPRRNAEIVAAADAVWAFPERGSRGTRITMAMAARRGIAVHVWEV